jgi:FkbM family methyltransferase
VVTSEPPAQTVPFWTPPAEPSLWRRFDESRRRYGADKWTKLRSLGHRLLLSRTAAALGVELRVTARLFCGDSMRVVLPEPVSTALYGYGIFDPEVTQLVMSCVRPGHTVFDVGAHFGYFSLLTAQLAGPQGQVHSFEPTPSTFFLLEQNVSSSAVAERISAVRAAVSDVGGQVIRLQDFGATLSAFNTIGQGRLGAAGRGRRTPTVVDVNTVSIDEYCAGRGLVPDVIKIDAEGAEERVLHGAVATLTRSRPTLIMEVGEASYRPLVEWVLATHQYQMWVRADDATVVQTDDLDATVRYKDVILAPAGRQIGARG